MGWRRSQHGSRSERVSPEHLFEGLRTLVETEPAPVPEGMLEEFEQECAERARQREMRQAQRAAKLARRAQAAARQAAAQRYGPEPPEGGAAVTSDKPDSPVAPVIELRPNAGLARRNSCLDGMKADVSIQQVPGPAKNAHNALRNAMSSATRVPTCSTSFCRNCGACNFAMKSAPAGAILKRAS